MLHYSPMVSETLTQFAELSVLGRPADQDNSFLRD